MSNVMDAILANESIPTVFDDSKIEFGKTENFVAVGRAGSDAGAKVKFYKYEDPNDFSDNPKSEVFCRIEFPGNTSVIHDQPVSEAEKKRFAHEWQAFERGQSQKALGTPIENWGFVARHPQKVDHLRHLGFETVEQIAAMAETSLPTIGIGAVELRQKARDFVTQSQTGIRKIETAEEKIARLEAKLEEVVEAKKRGRPKKEENDGKLEAAN